ncbi:gfo/Idh/MocA family oxidoreductase [bacterium]|nr:gfo/Idh/MocA family oxidoreductase [bacterium]
MADKLRVGVVGVGHLGQHHARNYYNNPRCELVYVCDANINQAKTIAKAYGAKATTDFTELIGQVDAVSIATPTVSHYEIASKFLDNKIHCLVEKPICTTVVDAAKLTAQARRNGLVLQVGHIEHFNLAVQKFKEILTTPRFIECHRQGPFDPRVRDVGVVLDLMIHDIDIILRIVNSPIRSIEAVGVAILTEKEDIANARLRFENGCIANVTVSRVTPKPLRKLRVFQDDAYISLDYRNQTMEVFRRRNRTDVVKPGEPKYFIESKKVRVKREEPLKLELDHFLTCIEKQILDPQTTGEQAMVALDVVIRITEIIRSTTVPFPVMSPPIIDNDKD